MIAPSLTGFFRILPMVGPHLIPVLVTIFVLLVEFLVVELAVVGNLYTNHSLD